MVINEEVRIKKFLTKNKEARSAINEEVILAKLPPTQRQSHRQKQEFVKLKSQLAKIKKQQRFVKQFRKFRAGGERLVSAAFAPPRAGRPAGSGKYQKMYGVGVREYRNLVSRQRAFAQAQQQAAYQQMLQKGYTPEEAEMLRVRRLQTAPSMRQEDFVTQNTISPNTLRMMAEISRIQNLPKTMDLNQQRIHRERRMVNQQLSLLNTPNMFKPSNRDFDLFDDTYNPLKAPNMFKERRDLPNPLNTRKLNLLQTREAGNDLRFL